MGDAMKPTRTELQYCIATCNGQEYMIWQMAKVFQIRRRDDPVMRCGGSLVGAAGNAERAVELILSDSRGTKVELGDWQVVGVLEAIPQPPVPRRQYRKRELDPRS